MAQILDIQTCKDTALKSAIALLNDGQPVAIPTETVYGLAADATNALAIARIYEMKGRPQFNPLICHMADLEMAKQYAEFNPLAEQLAETFWPGALTLILPHQTSSAIASIATAQLDHVGVRVPKGLSAQLIAKFGKPLAAPSANTSGRISPTTAQHVADDLGDKIKLILDQGPCNVGVESTIIKVMGHDLYLLRPGGISVEEIERATGHKVIRPDTQTNGAKIQAQIQAQIQSQIQAPGMMLSHYAPNASVRLDASRVQNDEVLINFANQTIEGAALAQAQYDLSPSGDLVEAASNLFALLHRADQHHATSIAIASIPSHGLGEAINDRLKRASTPR